MYLLNSLILLFFLSTSSSLSISPFPAVNVNPVLFNPSLNDSFLTEQRKRVLTNYLVQRPSALGTAYYLLSDLKFSKPVYRSIEFEANHEVVIFPDPTYPPGEGHYVLLWKPPALPMMGIHAILEPIYERFKLHLTESLLGTATEWDGIFQAHQAPAMSQPTYLVESTAGQVSHRAFG